jgi:hypothetical protein
MAQLLNNLDVKYIYLIIIVLSFVVLIYPIGLPLSVGPRAIHYYQVINSLPEGSMTLVEFQGGTTDYLNLEFYPSLVASINQMISRNFKILFMTSGSESDSAIFMQWLTDKGIFKFNAAGKVYGRDYVIIGWIAGSEVGLGKWAKDIIGTKPYDNEGRSLADMPMMAGVTDVSVFKIFMLASHEMGEIDLPLRQIATPFHLPPLLIGTSAQSGQYISYVSAGVALEVLAGARAAAEYEKVSGQPGTALASMDCTTTQLVALIGCVIIGNIGYLASVKPWKKGETKEKIGRME